jgi:hypothetical protein
MTRDKEKWKEGRHKGKEGSFRGSGYVLFLDCGDASMFKSTCLIGSVCHNSIKIFLQRLIWAMCSGSCL